MADAAPQKAGKKAGKKGDAKPKTRRCFHCQTEGTKMMCCSQCHIVWYCGKACQKEAWSGHKKQCRRVMRERARVLDKAAADYAADEAMAADACRAVFEPAPSRGA